MADEPFTLKIDDYILYHHDASSNNNNNNNNNNEAIHKYYLATLKQILSKELGFGLKQKNT